MDPSRRPRYTIGQYMVGIALTAALLAIPRLLNSPDRLIGAALIGVMLTLVLLNALVERTFGKTCPACSRRALRRLARHSHYYLCTECRARFKWFWVGPWLDASGPEDASRYRRRSEAGNWTEYAAPEDLDGSSSGHLLQSKRTKDLLGEVKRYPPRPGSRRRLEEAERKVREFLKHRHEIEE